MPDLLFRARTAAQPRSDGFRLLAEMIPMQGHQYPEFYRSVIARSVLNGAVSEMEGRDLLLLLQDVGAPLRDGHDEAALPQ